MHSNVLLMLSKKAAAMPLGSGAFPVLCLANSRLRISRPEVSRQNLNNKQFTHLLTKSISL